MSWPSLDPHIAQTAPVGLTLPEAIARGLDASHRLAELVGSRRRRESRGSSSGNRPRARSSRSSRATRARITSRSSACPMPPGGVRVIYPDIPDNVRSRVDLQWPIYTGGRLQALTRAAGAEADATQPGPRSRSGRSETRNHPRVLGGHHRARIAGCRGAGVGTNQRASRRRAESVECRVGTAERRAVDRSAAGAAADAADRSREHPRDGVCGISDGLSAWSPTRHSNSSMH